MMISRALIVLLFFLNLNNTLAWDGCWYNAWRCGDTCIYAGDSREKALCKCGEEIFNHTAQMWCCNDELEERTYNTAGTIPNTRVSMAEG